MNVRLATATIAVAAAATALLTACGSTGSTGSTGSSSSSNSKSPTSSSAPAANVTYPLTLTAANGPVTIKARPQRIVSLSATATEDLYAVGAGAQVVAVDSDSDYPSTAPKTSLNSQSPNLEAIARYNPDLVIAAQNTGSLVAGLAKLKIPVLIEPAATKLADAYTQISQVGQATGHQARANQIVQTMRTQIQGDIERAGESHKNLTYYWELTAKPYYSVTSQTFIGQIVGLFGLTNIADAAAKASDGGYPQLSDEYIVGARPQIIFLADNQAAHGGQSPSVVAKRPGWEAIPAVKDTKIVGLNDDIASRWGPRLPQLIAQIAQAVESTNR